MHILSSGLKSKKKEIQSRSMAHAPILQESDLAGIGLHLALAYSNIHTNMNTMQQFMKSMKSVKFSFQLQGNQLNTIFIAASFKVLK